MFVSVDAFHAVYVHDAESLSVTLHFISTLSPIKTTELLGTINDDDMTDAMFDETTET